MWSGSHIETANYALQYIDDPKMKDALADLAWSWSERDRDSALAWAEENIKDPSLIDRIRLDSIQSKIWENPGQAAEKLSELPEGKMRQELYASVANNWASSHLEAAREWANGLPEGIERDLALSSVTSAWIADDTARRTRIHRGQPGARCPDPMAAADNALEGRAAQARLASVPNQES